MKLKDKSCHLNDIPAKILKSVSFLFSYMFEIIFNKCIKDGVYKSGERSKVSNYRPISNLLSFNKIFEKIIYGRLIDFVNTHSLISPKQLGFGTNSNTSLVTLI